MEAALGAIGTGLLLAWVRASAALVLLPVLGTRALPPLVALLLAAALAPALVPAAPWTAVPEAAELAVLAAREAAVGALLGASARFAFSVFESAGRLSGAAAGGRAEDPLGALFALVGAGAFLLAGGHHAIVAALAGSFRSCPPGAPLDPGAAIDGAVALFSSAFAGAVATAAPAFAAGIAAEAAAAIASRAAPLAGFEASAPLLRAICVQVAAVGALIAAVRLGVELLNAALAGVAGVS